MNQTLALEPNCFAQPSSFILHPSSFILHPSSFILDRLVDQFFASVHTLTDRPSPFPMRRNSMLNARAVLPALFCALVVTNRAAADERALPKAESGLCAVLPDGSQIELLAVGDVPTGEKSWWQPDGIPFEQAPTRDVHDSPPVEPNTLVRAFVFRTLTDGSSFTPPGSNDPIQNWWLLSSGHNEKGKIGEKIREDDYFIFSAAMWHDARVTIVRDYIDHRWKTVSTADQQGRTITHNSLSGRVVWDKPVKDYGGFRISVSCRLAVDVARIRALDDNSRLHFPEHDECKTDAETTRLIVHFFELPLASVKEFRLETRAPKHQVEFRNISLHRGQKSPVQIYLDGKPCPSRTRRKDEG